MARIFPFRALRPVPAVAARVASVPYDVVNTDEARALAAGEPLGFLRATRAEIDLPPATDPHAEEVYERAVRNFATLREAAPLVREDAASLYVYRLQMGAHVQTGLAACYSIDEYEQGLIRKHEHTRRDKEDDRTRHMIALRAQTGVVFLTYRASAAVNEIVARVCAQAPLFDLTAPDDVQHTVWRVPAVLTKEIAAAFERIPSLYIADGHHRAASAARARSQLRADGAGTGHQECDTMLAVAFPHDQVQILPYNRVVSDLAGLSPDTFLEQVRARFDVRGGGSVPERRGEVAMFVSGRWHIVAGRDVPMDDPVGRLDATWLQERLIAPILGVRDLKTDRRIDFVGGVRGAAELERRVSSGEAAVAFSMYPVTVEDLMAISDAGGIMPPKSTWFEPKLRDGLLIHEI